MHVIEMTRFIKTIQLIEHQIGKIDMSLKY